MSPLSVATWVLCLVGAWFVIGTAVGLVFGRILRARDLQWPRPTEFADAQKARDAYLLSRMRSG
jgi:hypothetical protein